MDAVDRVIDQWLDAFERWMPDSPQPEHATLRSSKPE